MTRADVRLPAGPLTAYLMRFPATEGLSAQEVRGETDRSLSALIALNLEADNAGAGWTDETQPRTERPVTLFRTGPTPASRWGFARLIRANRATFPHGPTA